ncbi:cytochrome c oxidase assembly protein subunit 15 [Jatrophihabitans sp. GAS493]|uniref:COX15/CtaA family protein n=1 Tax=Jatrophihabitans sp. GAS493 TaxID=1907575 RepID=UPI000BB695A1|nr:COX15/CtaA family protein [Jatrophihabitans sp. GAS493]SOD73995.1 cytochrome c oxidase assembly protein subunit 15 [Jatrophihabitans sp. GAS493]
MIRQPATLRWLAFASVVANVGIVLTGGVVRLTSSGLGCPTWPTCTDSSLVPTAATAGHGLIEFSNRMLTFVLVVIAVSTLVVAVLQRRERALATVALLGIPAQAVLGGITVLTELNPWAVGCHFLLSMALIAVTYTLWWRLDHAATEGSDAAPDDGVGASDRWAVLLSRIVAVAVLAVLALGTVVTGSGPHAGDSRNGRVHRNGFDPAAMSQLHADAVMILIGLTIGLLILVVALRLRSSVVAAVKWLLVIELAQGLIGFVQYFTHLPALLVAVHMLGACLVWLATLRVLYALRAPVRTPVTLEHPRAVVAVS